MYYLELQAQFDIRLRAYASHQSRHVGLPPVLRPAIYNRLYRRLQIVGVEAQSFILPYYPG